MDFNFFLQPLRNAFRRMGIPPSFVPDHLDSFLSYTVVNYLKKVKQQVRNRLRGGRGGIRFPGTSREREFFYLYTQVLGTMEYLRML